MTPTQLDAAEAAFRAAYLDPGLMRHALKKALEAATKADEWRGIESAPWDTDILLGWESSWPAVSWTMEVGWAGRRNSCPPESGASNGWQHGSATHWRPLPAPPESAP
jgi:hypothetical protein